MENMTAVMHKALVTPLQLSTQPVGFQQESLSSGNQKSGKGISQTTIRLGQIGGLDDQPIHFE